MGRPFAFQDQGSPERPQPLPVQLDADFAAVAGARVAEGAAVAQAEHHPVVDRPVGAEVEAQAVA